jgi:hypothetical protein
MATGSTFANIQGDYSLFRKLESNALDLSLWVNQATCICQWGYLSRLNSSVWYAKVMRLGNVSITETYLELENLAISLVRTHIKDCWQRP